MKSKSDLAKEIAHTLYLGEQTPHRSCGICLAETFGLQSTAYQSLRRGGILGMGECGAIKAGELVLGEILGDPNPTGMVTEPLKKAAIRYRELWSELVDRGQSQTIICNDLTGQFADFKSRERLEFCTNIAATVAFCVAKTLDELGVEYRIADINALIEKK